MSRLEVDALLRAVRGIAGDRRRPVPLHEPEFRGREWDYVKECIDTGWVSSVGAYVDRFEEMLRQLTGAAHAVATVNGTAALHLAMRLVGTEPGDEVLVPTLTFIGTANAIAYASARPHFVDSESRTLGVDCGKLDRYLSDIAELRNGLCVNKRTGARIRAIVPVHLFGHACDMDALLRVAAKFNLVVVEDAAESLGSTYRGVHMGRFGHLSTLSFNGNKIVTTGGGGAILTDDPTLGARAKHLSTTARVAHQWAFIHDEIGYNYRLPNINAALGCAQLERLTDFVRRKRLLAQRYAAAFADIASVTMVQEPPQCRSNYWLIAILIDGGLTERNELLQSLNDTGFMARPCWTLMHELPMYRDCQRMDLQGSSDIAARLINLPSSPALVD